MKISHYIFITLVAVLISGCAGTSMSTYHAGGSKTLCNGKNLGYVAVLPETAWREDQKEPEKRKQMAMQEIQRSFNSFPCGSLATPGGIRSFSNWSNMSEAALLEKFSKEGVDTVILLRIDELTPQLYITYSIPFLWSGSNEADFHIRALSVNNSNVLADMRVKRVTGGVFNIRSAHWSRYELNGALLEIIGNGN